MQSALINFDDLAQLNELVEHFQFHSEAYGDNLVVFFSKHYGELKDKHEKNDSHEKHQHEQLPFNHHSCAHSLNVFILDFHESVSLLPIVEKQNTTNFHYKDFYSSFEKQQVFQPPKLA
jgi:hypothetical protein